ncbi:endonuclease/exonuclease/phosphatase family protein [Halomonas korlensis]|uniref:Metal-dependent hydrolase, endonuclease/exonuclease/phosphatase family n=1 Tax=Halomonas korlensis TaxID=463301 RepID=A0A1I7KMH7_9GAMM|nr:Metal-dependent hydrolase, endonuclease/exonuclease/phosphatase family [Halomonas korlensis]
MSTAGQVSQKNTRSTARLQTLHIMTINVHKGFSFFNRRHVLPELRDAVNTLSTDMVFLQEVIGVNRKHAIRFYDWPDVPQYEYLADTMWPDFAYGRNAVYPDGDHGNALLSRFPILSYENRDISITGTEERGLLHCLLDVPGHSRVHAICVHLGLRQAHRLEQLMLLCELLESIPKSEPIIIAGDFNDWRLQANKILAECDVHEVFVSHYGRPAKSFPARWPFLRLDRIYIRNACVRNPEALYHRPWSHLSDHVPLIAEVCL